MNSYMLKNQEPLSNQERIKVVTVGSNMTFLRCFRTYGLLSTWSAQVKYYSDVTQYNRLAATVAHFTVFPMFKDKGGKNVFLKDQKKIKTPIFYLKIHEKSYF